MKCLFININISFLPESFPFFLKQVLDTVSAVWSSSTSLFLSSIWNRWLLYLFGLLKLKILLQIIHCKEDDWRWTRSVGNVQNNFHRRQKWKSWRPQNNLLLCLMKAYSVHIVSLIVGVNVIVCACALISIFYRVNSTWYTF